MFRRRCRVRDAIYLEATRCHREDVVHLKHQGRRGMEGAEP